MRTGSHCCPTIHGPCARSQRAHPHPASLPSSFQYTFTAGMVDAALHAPRAGRFLPQRFPAALESDYVGFSLRVFRPGIRAWHTAALAMAILLVLAATGLHLIGSAYPVFTASPWLFVVALSTRATLCYLAWRTDFETVYARAALPLACADMPASTSCLARRSSGPTPATSWLLPCSPSQRASSRACGSGSRCS